MSKIPKKIHYVWIGDSPKSEFILKCIESWKKHLPDFEIKEWGNDSLLNIDNRYALDAYNNKKWAFASDYIRLYALFHEGGIYLDTDVEITNKFDEFLSLDFFTCNEIYNNSCLPVTSAVMGAKKGNRIIKDLLNIYDSLEFKINDKFDLTPNTVRISEYFKTTFNILPPYFPSNQIQLVENSIIFPSSHFCKPEIHKNNYAIHHFMGSWLTDYVRRDKFSIFNKFVLTRFKIRRDTKNYGLKENERILLKFKVSSKKVFALILRN